MRPPRTAPRAGVSPISHRAENKNAPQEKNEPFITTMRFDPEIKQALIRRKRQIDPRLRMKIVEDWLKEKGWPK